MEQSWFSKPHGLPLYNVLTLVNYPLPKDYGKMLFIACSIMRGFTVELENLENLEIWILSVQV